MPEPRDTPTDKQRIEAYASTESTKAAPRP